MNKLPTDRQILERIFGEYRAEFRNFSEESRERDSRIYVPISVQDIASRLETDPEELFGRLYYHLDYKYRYKKDDGSVVHLFALSVGNDRNCINFPYLASVVSQTRSEYAQAAWSLWLSIGSIAIALLALGAQIFGHGA